MNKTLWINGRFLGKPVTGVQRYALELSKRLHGYYNCTYLRPNADKDLNFKQKNVAFIGGRSYIWEQVSLPFYLKKMGSPLLINFANLAPVTYSNQIVCIHDLAVFENPKWFSRSFAIAYRLLLPRIARNARKILTVSEFSKYEISKHLNIPEAKIEVIPNGFPKFDIVKSPSKFSFPYILTIGGFDPRKNVNKLIEALYFLKNTELKLVIVGRPNSLFNSILSEQNSRVIVIQNPSNDELQLLLANAEVYVHASLYEGFGMPPMEALALGIPVALSDIPVFKEVYSGFVRFFDPNNCKDIAAVIAAVIENKAEISITPLREKYDWDSSCAKLATIIEDML